MSAKVELIPDPVSIDLEIQKVQEKLAGISWIEKAFGKCRVQAAPAREFTRLFSGTERKGRLSQQADIIFPEVSFKGEPYSLMMDDNFSGYCFFMLDGPMTFPTYDFTDLQATAVQPLAVIFWGKEEAFDPQRKHNLMEAMRLQVFNVLKTCPSLRILSSTTDRGEVFRPFTITDTFRGFLKPGRAAFRFNAELHFVYNKIC